MGLKTEIKAGVGRGFACILIWLCCANFAAADVIGTCVDYFDDPDAVGEVLDDGTVIRNEPIPVLRDAAVIYDAPSSLAAGSKTLPFGDRVFITRLENGFYQLSYDIRKDPVEAIGWVKGDDLLCRNKPILNEEGISRKFYIRTKASFADESDKSITAKAGPDSDTCAGINGKCRELSRFTLYYVYAIDEAAEKILLIGQPTSSGDTPLIGWVSLKDGYLWDTRFGLRPKENLVFDEQKGDWKVGEERRACLFETIEQAAQGASENACFVPILGGNRWFNYSLRIPVFDRIEKDGKSFYHVAMPTSGVGADAADDVLSQVKGLDEAIALLKNLGNLDVFFLIDGTQSMQPHIDALTGRTGGVGVLGSIQDAFTSDPRFEGVQVRFGYRVYRDHYAGDSGIGEGLPFTSNCNPTTEELQADNATFQQGIQQISSETGTGGIKDTDHEENLIMGLAIAADDMSACKDHVKLLFVVGDTGYDIQAQEARNQFLGEADILTYMTQNYSTDVDPIIPFFIQVPKVESRLNLTGARLQNYLDAYDKFTLQGQFFAQQIGAHFTQGLKGNPDIKINEHFYSLDGQDIAAAQTQMIEYILDRVSKFGDQRPINEVIAELQGGEALVKIISALQQGNVPALRLAQIEKRICEELGKACQERVYNDITEGYILENDDIVLDVWLGGEEFRSWRSKLELVKDTSQVPPKELSKIIIKMMVDGLQNSTGDLSPTEMNMSIAEFLKLKHGLPTGEQTPLLNYSIGDFVYQDDVTGGDDKELVEICELYRVARWLERHREVFDAVDNAEVPLFELQEVESCDMRFPTPELVTEGRERFPEETMGFRKAQLGRTILWIPNAYLP